MKKTFVTILAIILVSCSSQDEQINKFRDIYYEILMIRQKFQDTTEANPKVRKLLDNYGYTELSFRDYSMELFKNDPQAFTAIIDSIRTLAEKKLFEFSREKMRLLDSTNKVKGDVESK